MRDIRTHMVNECNENLRILACDEPGSGGANHRYQIVNVSKQNTGPEKEWVEADFDFQNGPIKEVGTNGVTHEALLAIVIDRMQAFQKGPYSCRENAIALTKLEEAMLWMHKRTRDRMARDVEGTHKV